MTDPLHVLVVDDEPRIRTMLRRYLVGEGFKVSDAADGAGMRAVLAREAINLVLLDLMMPGEDGLPLARHIRQRSEIPIIMLTGKGDLIDRVAGLETGADDYITKPFELREILARIRTVLRRAAPRAPPAASVFGSAVDGKAGEVLMFEGWRLDLGATGDPTCRYPIFNQANDVVPDPSSGEAVKIVVVNRNPLLTVEDLKAHCRKYLAACQIAHQKWRQWRKQRTPSK